MIRKSRVSGSLEELDWGCLEKERDIHFRCYKLILCLAYVLYVLLTFYLLILCHILLSKNLQNDLI
jgi:hypothetical protein